MITKVVNKRRWKTFPLNPSSSVAHACTSKQGLYLCTRIPETGAPMRVRIPYVEPLQLSLTSTLHQNICHLFQDEVAEPRKRIRRFLVHADGHLLAAEPVTGTNPLSYRPGMRALSSWMQSIAK